MAIRLTWFDILLYAYLLFIKYEILNLEITVYSSYKRQFKVRKSIGFIVCTLLRTSAMLIGKFIKHLLI